MVISALLHSFTVSQFHKRAWGVGCELRSVKSDQRSERRAEKVGKREQGTERQRLAGDGSWLEKPRIQSSVNWL